MADPVTPPSPDIPPWDFQEVLRLAIAGVVPTSVEVVKDDGLKDAHIEEALLDKGAVVVVFEPNEADAKAQSGQALGLNIRASIALLVNFKVNASPDGAQIKPMEVVWQILGALAKRPRHPGGHFLQVEDPAFRTKELDPGVRGYVMSIMKDTSI